MKIVREWCMPNKNTLSIKPIREWVNSFLLESLISVDPFALNCNLTTLTNDIDITSGARYNLKAIDFLNLPIVQDADLVIFDPPYSLEQIKRNYNNNGYKFFQEDTRNCVRWTKERNKITEFQKIGNIVLSFGWSSTCMGKKRGYEISSILLCSHGPAHNDTICVAEKKLRLRGKNEN